MANQNITATSLRALFKLPGKVVSVIFDNDMIWFFKDEDVDDLIVEIGGTEFIKQPHNLPSNHNGRSGANLPATEYKPVGTIQAVIILDNPDDYKYIDEAAMYVE